MRKKTFALASLAIVTIAVASGLVAVQLSHDHDGKKTHMAWKDVFETPQSMTRGVDGIVVARHVGTSPGRVAFGENAEDVVPFELNHFVVERGIKGLPAGASLTVERVGGDANGMTVLLDADGGPYVAGQQYALFVNKQPESDFYYLVNDEGRYSVDATERLVPVSHASGKVAAALGGLSLAEFTARTEGALRHNRVR